LEGEYCQIVDENPLLVNNSRIANSKGYLLQKHIFKI
jgi:hypothetical protein